jgi:hypothetical protein
MPEPEASAVVARLAAGLADVEPVLTRCGFKLAAQDAGKGSGGYLASADFIKGDRTVHLWLRFNSLSVSYDLGGHELSHSDYMRELLGAGGGNRFPAFADDRAQAFAALRHDLATFCEDFLVGPGQDYLRCWKAASEDANLTGLQRLARIEEQLKRR